MKNDEFRSKDLYESACLYSYPLKLLKLEKSGNSFWFVFENKSKAECLSDKYWRREANVDAKTYAASVRSLKDMVYARINRG